MSLKGFDALNKANKLMESMETSSKVDSFSNIESRHLAYNGKYYGIVKENARYILKISSKVNALLVEDFEYINGVQNKTKFSHKSYNDAHKQFNLINIEHSRVHGDSLLKEALAQEEKFVLKAKSKKKSSPPQVDMGAEDFGSEEGGEEFDMGDEELDMDGEDMGGDEPSDDPDDYADVDTKDLSGGKEDIQSGAGKVAQMLRDYEDEDKGDLSQFVTGMVASALPEDLEEKDQNEILKKFEDKFQGGGEESEEGMEDLGDEEGFDMGDEGGEELDMEESVNETRSALDNLEVDQQVRGPMDETKSALDNIHVKVGSFAVDEPMMESREERNKRRINSLKTHLADINDLIGKHQKVLDSDPDPTTKYRSTSEIKRLDGYRKETTEKLQKLGGIMESRVFTKSQFFKLLKENRSLYEDKTDYLDRWASHVANLFDPKNPRRSIRNTQHLIKVLVSFVEDHNLDVDPYSMRKLFAKKLATSEPDARGNKVTKDFLKDVVNTAISQPTFESYGMVDEDIFFEMDEGCGCGEMDRRDPEDMYDVRSDDVRSDDLLFDLEEDYTAMKGTYKEKPYDKSKYRRDDAVFSFSEDRTFNYYWFQKYRNGDKNVPEERTNPYMVEFYSEKTDEEPFKQEGGWYMYCWGLYPIDDATQTKPELEEDVYSDSPKRIKNRKYTQNYAGVGDVGRVVGDDDATGYILELDDEGEIKETLDAPEQLEFGKMNNPKKQPRNPFKYRG